MTGTNGAVAEWQALAGLALAYAVNLGRVLVGILGAWLTPKLQVHRELPTES